MKSFDQLSIAQRHIAIKRAKSMLVGLVIEGIIELEIPDPKVQNTLEVILRFTRKNENPTEGLKLMLSNKVISTELDRISIAAAEGAEYNESDLLLMDEQ